MHEAAAIREIAAACIYVCMYVHICCSGLRKARSRDPMNETRKRARSRSHERHAAIRNRILLVRERKRERERETAATEGTTTGEDPTRSPGH